MQNELNDADNINPTLTNFFHFLQSALTEADTRQATRGSGKGSYKKKKKESLCQSC